MAVEYLRRFQDQTGGFGAFLFFASEWADPEATRRSYELFARRVAPRFDGRPERRETSFRWKVEHREMLAGRMAAGINAARERHAADPG
jgi:limonene 1,2-monooxygenase